MIAAMRFRLGRNDTFDWEWYRYPRKDGKPGAWRYRPGPWYTPVLQCDLCGRMGTHRTVQTRWDCRPMNDFRWRVWTLCLGCWNRVRPLWAAYRKIEALRKLARKLRRAHRDVQT